MASSMHEVAVRGSDEKDGCNNNNNTSQEKKMSTKNVNPTGIFLEHDCTQKKDKQEKISVNLTHTNIDLDISKEKKKKNFIEQSDVGNSATLNDANSHRLDSNFNIIKKKNKLSADVLNSLHVINIDDDGGGGNKCSKITDAVSFSSALSNREKLNINDFISQKEFWQPYVTKDSIRLPDNLIEENEKIKVTYLCFKKAGGGGFSPVLPTKNELREALFDVWSNIVYIERGKHYSTVCITFRTEDEAKQQACEIRETSAYKLIPEYRNRRNTKVTVRAISNDVDPWGIFALVDQYGEIVSAEVIRDDMWSGGITMIFQILMSPDHHRSIPELCHIAGAETKALRLTIQGRKPSCYACGSRAHLRAFCPEQLEKRRKGKQSPEASPQTVPPVKAPEEVTTMAKSVEAPPRSIVIPPVAAPRELAPSPAPEMAAEVDEAEPDTLSSAALSPPVVDPMRFASPPVPGMATEAEDEDEADALSSTTLSTQEEEGQMETNEPRQNKGGKTKKRKKAPKKSASEKGKKVCKAQEKNTLPLWSPLCRRQHLEADPEWNPEDYPPPKLMGFTVIRGSNDELGRDLCDCLKKEKNPHDILLEWDSKLVASFRHGTDRYLIHLTPAYYHRLKQGFPQDVGCFLKHPSQKMLTGAFGCTPFQYKEWRKTRDVGCSGPT